MKHDIMILSAQDVASLYPMKDAIRVIEKAFKDFASGKMRMPSKVYLDLPEYHGDFRAMPAFSLGDKMASVKWVNSHPGNTKKNIPAVMGTLILNDAKTALPLAIIEATVLTGIRTGAAGGVAAKYLSRKNATIASFIGSGTQAHFQMEALLAVRPVKEIRLFDMSKKAIDHTVTWLSKFFTGKVIVTNSIDECIFGTDIIVTTTPGEHPAIDHIKAFTSGVHINAIGADAPGKQEIASKLLKKCRIYVDEWEQSSHSGEVNVPLSQKKITGKNISGSLGEVLTGSIKGRETPDDITLFDSTGLAIQDLASAAHIYRMAKKQKKGKYVNLM